MIQENYYRSDIDLNFGETLTGDISKKTDADAIKQSIVNIVMMDRKPFQPTFGCGIYRQLMENYDPILLRILQSQVENKILQREPMVSTVSVKISPADIDNNGIVIKIYFKMKGSSETYQISKLIEVLR